MANITTSGTSDYPGSLDTRTTLTDGAGGDEIVANHPNGLGAAVINIETELGADPAGTLANLGARLGQHQNTGGQIVLGSTTATVGVLPNNRGGLGLVVASSTFTDGYFPIVGNGAFFMGSPTATAGGGLTVTLGSGTFSYGLTSTAKLSGDWVQARRVTVTGFTTTNGTIAVDNTPIQSSEGSGFGLSVDLLPTSTANSVYVWYSLTGCNDTTLFSPVGLFLAGSTSAVWGSVLNSGAAANVGSTAQLYRLTTVSTATTTYALRIGGSGGTFTLNGQSGAGLFGNACTSELMVYEVQN